MTPPEQLINLVLIPVAGILLMLLPVAVERVWRPGPREPLDGFTFGALAGLCFTAGGTVTQQASEFSKGLVAHDFPLDALLATAAVRGIAAPLTALAIGGVVGATLWFTPRTATARRWRVVTSPVTAVVIGVLADIGQNGIDYLWIPYSEIVALYAVITVLALVALRIVLHCTLVDAQSDDVGSDQAVLCPQCTHVVPDRGFCVNCGVAADAASRSSREARRATRPIPAAAAAEGQ
jgi:PrsW family intramembrane metalloprotease